MMSQNNLVIREITLQLPKTKPKPSASESIPPIHSDRIGQNRAVSEAIRLYGKQTAASCSQGTSGRKRYRNEGSPSPRPSPKRRREHSPDSDAYNSGDEKNEKHRLLSQVVRPQDSRSLSPSHLLEDRQGRWKEEDRKPERKESSRRYEEPELKEKFSSVDKQRELAEIMESSRTRAQDILGHHQSSDRDVSDRSHEENKRRVKIQKKPIKKKKEEDVGIERTHAETTSEDSQVFSPKKGQKKKSVDKKRKRSKGDSDISDEEAIQQSKKKKGPRTPPVLTQGDLVGISRNKDGAVEEPQKKEDTAFSDWSDEDVPDRTEAAEPELTAGTAVPVLSSTPLSSLLPPPPPLATPTNSTTAATTLLTCTTSLSTAAPSEETHRKCHRARVEKGASPHVGTEDAPHRKPLDQKRSSSLGSNRSNRSHTSGRLRSPSTDSAHRSGDDQSGRKRALHGSSRDREKTKSLEITGERRSRIDQLKRGEPSRSTSSDRQDSRSHSSRRSSPESDRQVHSRSGSFDSRDRLQERDRYEHDRDRERERRDTRQREWDREADKDWARNRDRDRLRERERERDKRRELDRERERLVPDATERERDRDRTFESASQSESIKRSETKVEGEHERDLEVPVREPVGFSKERAERDLGSAQAFEDSSKAERTESVEGDEESRLDDAHSLGSGAGEGYEPISDDELDEILAGDAEKRDDQQDDEKMPDPLDVIDVDWSGLMPKHPKEPREPGAALLKFTPGAVMLRVGISKKLAGPELFTKVKDTCQRVLEKPKDADSLFEHDLGALNMAALLRKEERANLLSNLGPCCKALCFRRDSAIRKQLVRNEKGAVKQAYTSAPLVDSELLRLSLRLLKRKATCRGPGYEKPDDQKLSQSTVQQEVCLS